MLTERVIPEGLLAFAVALVASMLALYLLRHFGVLDHPNERSSHVRPTPRGGGLGPALGVMIALVLSNQVQGTQRAGILVAACAFGFIGLLDDVLGLPALPRLALQALGAALTLPFLLPGLSGPLVWRLLFGAGAFVWLASYVNAFNFMDGIDGMAVAQTVVAGLAWYATGLAEDVPALAAGGLILAAAALGFAPFNIPQARVFLGDTGSYFLGGAVAAVAVVGLRAGVPPEAVVAPLALYLADTGSTLVRRIREGETWYLPHCDHAYQRFVRRGWSHPATTLLVAGVMIACSVLGAASLLGSLAARIAADAALLGVVAAFCAAPARLAVRGTVLVLPPVYPARPETQVVAGESTSAP